ncbi:MAG: RHS repeat protein [Clostridium sp.]|nr:RHS repeat protein [Bacteroides sp.]MCM1198675.1 RHS repeat protein [Clostridium sp.]
MKTQNRFLAYIHAVLAFLPLCSYAQVVRVTEMTGRKIENIPTYYHSWTYTDEYDTSSGNNHYGNSNNEVGYYFTIAQPAIVVVSTSGSVLDETSMMLSGTALYSRHETGYFSDSSAISEEQRLMLDVLMQNMDTDLTENMEQIKSGQAFLCVSLQAGYYSVCCEGTDIGIPNNGKIRTSIYVCYLGQSMEDPIDLGVHGQEFKTQCIHMVNTFENSSPLYFKVSYTTLTELSVDGVGKRGIYGKLSVMNAAGQVLYTSDQYPTKKYYPQIDKCQLPPGTYYICSYLEYGAGELFVNIKSAPSIKRGDGMETPYILPSFAADITRTIKYNTSTYTDRYQANGRKDVFVGLRLLEPFRIVMGNDGSTVSGGIVVTLADNQGNPIVRLNTSGNPEAQASADVSSGFYYLILEGAKNDGEVVVKLIMTRLDHPLVKNYFSPDKASNYIVSAIPAVDIVSGGEDSEGGNMLFTVNYYDGLGRADQSVFQRGLQERSTMLSCTQYDSFGRPDRSWNPVPGKDDGDRMSHDDVAAVAESFYDDKAAYSTTVYADSPLEQVSRMFNPGEIWRRDDSAIDIRYNTDSLVKYSVIGDRLNGELVVDGYYIPGDLKIEEIQDENGYLTKEYRDCYGHDVCIDREGLKTFKVYDLYGNLRYVLPPCVNGDITNTNLEKYAYIYNYNERNLCIAKKIPGADWSYFIYDKADYPVYSQDGELHANGEWLCSIPDAYGHEVIRAIASTASDVAELAQNNVIAVFDKESPTGYSMQYTPKYDSVLCINYYDNYDFMFLAETPEKLKYQENQAYGRRYGNDIDEFRHKGLLTGSFGKVLGSSDESVWTAYYYDMKQRQIQTRRLLPSGGEHVLLTKYNFDGTVEQSEESIRPWGNAGYDIIYTKNAYDAEGRLTEVTTCLNDTITSVTSYGYDPVGRMTSVTNGALPEPIYTEKRYNVRNWLVSSRNREFKSELFYVDSLNMEPVRTMQET